MTTPTLSEIDALLARIKALSKTLDRLQTLNTRHLSLVEKHAPHRLKETV